MTIKRIGFACKFSEINHKGEVVSIPDLNTGGTTLAWAKRQSRAAAEEKIIEVAKRNILHTHNLVKRVATLEPELRMVRLTSDMLSFYTHEDYQPFWQSHDIQTKLAHWFAPIGETARKHDVRLSFHPDQFVVLASDREEVVNNSLPANFLTSGKTNEEIARECSAREMASNIIKQCLNNIYRVAGKKEFKKESWE